MSDLAALLHDIVCSVTKSQHNFRFDPNGILSDCRLIERRLEAANVRVAAPRSEDAAPRECHAGCDLCGTLNEMDADAAAPHTHWTPQPRPDCAACAAPPSDAAAPLDSRDTLHLTDKLEAAYARIEWLEARLEVPSDAAAPLDAMVAELVGVEATLADALRRLTKALALAPTDPDR